MQIDNVNDRVHFPGLNSLRFFAALSVFIGHCELTKKFLSLPNNFELFDRINFGGIGVYFFFVLSGFLITYLLCVEKDRFGTISIKRFYLRRILRIWPLYYLIVALGFFILPAFDFFTLMPVSFNQNYNQNLLLYILILPNLAYAYMPSVPHIGQAWSIGVEEQFYIFWPLMVKRFRNISQIILISIVVYMSVKLLVLVYPYFGETGVIYTGVKRFFGMSKFECMLIGAFGGVMVFNNKERFLKIVYSPLAQLSALGLFGFLSYFAGTESILQDAIHLPLSVLFLIIILNVATNPASILKLNIGLLDYLGKISYGFYMYHLIFLFLVTKLIRPYYTDFPIASNFLIYVVSFIATGIISHLSYRFFEKYFIKRKKKFTQVISE